jgi:hypothetical protein
MKAAEARKLIGQKVFVRKHSGITSYGVILSVQGRNVEVDFYGMSDWLWLPDCTIKPIAAELEGQ